MGFRCLKWHWKAHFSFYKQFHAVLLVMKFFSCILTLQPGPWLLSVQLTEVCRANTGHLAHFVPLQQACALSTGEIAFAPSKCKISSQWHCNNSVKAWDLPSRRGCLTNFSNSLRIQTNLFKACIQFANHTRTVKLLKRPNEHLISNKPSNALM